MCLAAFQASVLFLCHLCDGGSRFPFLPHTGAPVVGLSLVLLVPHLEFSSPDIFITQPPLHFRFLFSFTLSETFRNHFAPKWQTSMPQCYSYPSGPAFSFVYIITPDMLYLFIIVYLPSLGVCLVLDESRVPSALFTALSSVIEL